MARKKGRCSGGDEELHLLILVLSAISSKAIVNPTIAQHLLPHFSPPFPSNISQDLPDDQFGM